MSGTAATALGALLLGLPLTGCVLCALLGPRLGRRFVNLIGPGVVGLAAVVAVVVLVDMLSAPADGRSTTVTLWNWIDLGSGNLRIGVDLTLDQLSTLMILVITGVGFLIHVYSVGYMEHDPTPHRFFSYMNLFIFSMLLLVLAADLAILVIGWALVALSSYLLIGYHYERPSAVLAARKAFITQVIGDVGLYLAAFLIVVNTGAHSLSLPAIFHGARSAFPQGGALITGICILLAVGAFAKSAQFPLHTWLPDAMEGPTPVSALIHAATMVTAGVYLIARFHVLFDLAPVAQGIVAYVGAGTALMAGVIALSQMDIKRVIAYSTMSQIGLMILAVGIGAYSAGMFHFATHAVFKALLFMAAGNVIHALHDEQDIGRMGGLARHLNRTRLSFLCGSFALAGIPLFAGYFSKEDLLGFGAQNGPAHPTLFILGCLVNVLTGIYAFRLYFVVFHGEPRSDLVRGAHEAPRSMLLPVQILAVASVVVGFVMYLTLVPGVFGLPALANFLEPVFRADVGGLIGEPAAGIALLTVVIGTAASLAGVGFAHRAYFQRQLFGSATPGWMPGALVQLSEQRFYFDELYDALLVRPTRAMARTMRRVVEPRYIDGAVRGVAGFLGELSLDFRALQSGLVRDYATIMLGSVTLGVVIVVLLVAR